MSPLTPPLEISLCARNCFKVQSMRKMSFKTHSHPPCRCHPLTQNPLPHKSKSHYPLPPNTHIHCHCHATSQINPHHKPTPPPLPHNPRRCYREDNVVLEDPHLPLPLPPPQGVLGLRRGKNRCRTKTRERREDREMKKREERENKILFKLIGACYNNIV